MHDIVVFMTALIEVIWVHLAYEISHKFLPCNSNCYAVLHGAQYSYFVKYTIRKWKWTDKEIDERYFGTYTSNICISRDSLSHYEYIVDQSEMNSFNTRTYGSLWWTWTELEQFQLPLSESILDTVAWWRSRLEPKATAYKTTCANDKMTQCIRG